MGDFHMPGAALDISYPAVNKAEVNFGPGETTF